MRLPNYQFTGHEVVETHRCDNPKCEKTFSVLTEVENAKYVWSIHTKVKPFCPHCGKRVGYLRQQDPTFPLMFDIHSVVYHIKNPKVYYEIISVPTTNYLEATGEPAYGYREIVLNKGGLWQTSLKKWNRSQSEMEDGRFRLVDSALRIIS